MEKEMGDRIRELRINNGISVEGLAGILNLSVSYIGLLERGERNPSLKKLVAISKIFNTSLDYLVFGNGSQPVPVQSVMINRT